MKLINQFMTVILTVILFHTSITVNAQSNGFNDAEIASIAVVANQIDIEFAEIALNNSRNNDVKNFAETMINDHNSVIDLAVKLVTKLGVTPKENELSEQLRADAEETKSMLRNTNRRSFDETYIDNEIAYHDAVIGAVRDVLIPQASNKELKELLEAVLPSLEVHLDHAKMVKKQL